MLTDEYILIGQPKLSARFIIVSHEVTTYKVAMEKLNTGISQDYEDICTIVPYAMVRKILKMRNR
jgi:hypothetical protein